MQVQYYNTYKEIKQIKPLGIRGHMRTLALDGLSVVDKIKGFQNELNRNRIQVLYFHHVFKDEEKKLELLLKRLLVNHSFISYSDAVDRILNRNIDRPYITFSSDDGLKNNIRAAEILDDFGAKACFFINPGIINNLNYDSVKTFCRDRIKFPPVEFLSWDDVERLQNMGHEIGSHTMNHINIANSAYEEIVEECTLSFEELTSRCGQVKHFAIPYGKYSDFNETGRKVVFSSGYVSCAFNVRGCHINPERDISIEELCILRDHVVLDWDINHVFYFLVNNSRKASANNNYFPYK
jgi:peptidoglycan/xylan/chitin deacetylase (PgdA/CDA1 family)